MRGALALFLLPCLVATADAPTWHILNDGSGDASTIQAGIDSAAVGDTVLVAPGTYYENINLRGKEIELRSSSGPEVTILDGSRGDNSVVMCDSGESERTIITGFTITGGTGRAFAGGERGGGGVVCLDSCPRIEGNIIRDNVALGCSYCISRGGALTFGGPNPCRVIVENNLFDTNTARGNGGAINVEGPSGLAILDGAPSRRSTVMRLRPWQPANIRVTRRRRDLPSSIIFGVSVTGAVDSRSLHIS